MKTMLSDEDLVTCIENHTRIGAEALYAKYSSALFKVICSNVKHKELAEDILQQAFLKAWNSVEQYHAQNGRLGIWMMGIARNLSKEAAKTIPANQHQILKSESLSYFLDDAPKPLPNYYVFGIMNVIPFKKPKIDIV